MITLEQALAEPPPPPLIHYPESDGKPMGDNDQQRDWIVKIIENLKALFAGRSDVYVSGDLFWYPIEGNNRIVQAPDAMVMFGRPPSQRGCYKQWEENGIPPQVVFEVLSPSNTTEEMMRKRAFYQKYGVEEYYLYDPSEVCVEGWLRSSTGLQPIAEINGWRSPRLGITFHLERDGLQLRRPDGQPFAEAWESIARAERLAAKLRGLGIDPDKEGD